MKNQPLTKKLKVALSKHFDSAGTVDNVPKELAGISMQDRQKCYEFWKGRRNRALQGASDQAAEWDLPQPEQIP